MAERPRFFDDLAGVAGGAMSALAGVRDEAEALFRARLDEGVRKLELVKREDLDAIAEMAARARQGQEEAESKLAAALRGLDALEARLAHLESRPPSAPTTPASPTTELGGPGMIA
jgi:BMFP domain-containing protein YqiC